MFTQVDIMTALITPFTDDNQIDYLSLEHLTNYLLEHGTKGFVIGGTTGEIATLTIEEKLTLYRRFSEIVAQRVPIIAGTGSNNTQATIELTQAVSEIAGIDAALVVVPYYNKPDQIGMLLHFRAVAKSSSLPIVIYNIPGRTVVKMTPQTVLQLAQDPNIIGIKQCGDLADLQAIIQDAPEDFAIYSGEDEQALTAKVLGAQGIISVASHCYGPQINAMYQALNQGDWQLAGKWQRLLTPKMQALFMYPSPSAVKSILNAQGFSVGSCRLPIATLSTAQEKLLAQNLQVTDLRQDLAFDIGG